MKAERNKIILVSTVVRLAPNLLQQFLKDEFEVEERIDLASNPEITVKVKGLEGAWGVVAGGESYTRELLSQLPCLRVIARVGVGYENVDIAAANEYKIAVLTTPGANSDAVADSALALMLGVLRCTRQMDTLVRSRKWRPQQPCRDLTGAVVGIVGLGAIGKQVARRLQGFGCKLLAYEPNPDLEFCKRTNITLMPLHAMLRNVDVLTIHAPLVAETHKLIGAAELALLPKKAILINTSRGGLVDKAALVRMLQNGELWGAGLDVFEHEPLPATHPLIGIDNVLLSGHVSSFTGGAVYRMLTMVAEGIKGYAKGEKPEGLINVEAIR